MLKGHEHYLSRCLDLAKKGMRKVYPNPMVGSVLVYNGEIVSEGYHQYYGGDHAEVSAIKNLKDKHLLSKVTLYVNLEPCCHKGKTPPCTDLIISSGIKNVVYSAEDPNILVAGKGKEILVEAGVNVLSGILDKEAIELNKRFYTFHKLKRPYIFLKWAETADGFIARTDYSSKWVSSEQSRKFVHQLRAREASVLVGYRTALYDNPKLTVRQVQGEQPTRILLDRECTLPESHFLLDGEVQTLVFTENPKEDRVNLNYKEMLFDVNFLENLLGELWKKKIISVIIEGGAETLKNFINNDKWDEAYVFTSQQNFKKGIKAPKLDFEPISITSIDVDRLSHYKRSH